MNILNLSDVVMYNWTTTKKYWDEEKLWISNTPEEPVFFVFTIHFLGNDSLNLPNSLLFKKIIQNVSGFL